MPLTNNEKARLIFDWHKIKIGIQLKADNSQLYFYEKDIWWASLGANIGHEEDGKNQRFERPVLILRKFNNYLALIVPLSSRLKQGNKYYYKFLLNNKYRSIIMSQIRIISSRRFIRKIGQIDNYSFEAVKDRIKLFI